MDATVRLVAHRVSTKYVQVTASVTRDVMLSSDTVFDTELLATGTALIDVTLCPKAAFRKAEIVSSTFLSVDDHDDMSEMGKAFMRITASIEIDWMVHQINNHHRFDGNLWEHILKNIGDSKVKSAVVRCPLPWK